jgi:hypothetical protein
MSKQNASNHNTSKYRSSHLQELTKSMERLSVYDGHGKVSILQINPKANIFKLIGDLDLDQVEEKM